MRTKIKSTATNSTGTLWQGLSSNPGTTKLTLINKTGTVIRARIVGTTEPGIALDDKDELPIYVVQNSNEVEIKRDDNSNVQVTLGYTCE